jgi:hypothetical protein
MPAEHCPDPVLLDAVAAALIRSSTAALEASHELLAHYGDTGDAPTQRAVDTLIDHAADALRALTDSFADISAELVAATAAATVHPFPSRPADADRLSRRPRPRPGRGSRG